MPRTRPISLRGEVDGDRPEDRDPAGDGGLEPEAPRRSAGRGLEVRPVVGDDVLVGGDDRLAGAAARPTIRVRAGSSPPITSTMTSTSGSATRWAGRVRQQVRRDAGRTGARRGRGPRRPPTSGRPPSALHRRSAPFEKRADDGARRPSPRRAWRRTAARGSVGARDGGWTWRANGSRRACGSAERRWSGRCGHLRTRIGRTDRAGPAPAPEVRAVTRCWRRGLARRHLIPDLHVAALPDEEAADDHRDQARPRSGRPDPA